MARYVYQGMYEDLFVSGGSVVWPKEGAAGNFSIALVQNHASLDTSSGLAARNLKTWGALDAQSAIAEMPTAGTNYVRKALNVLARSYNWDAFENLGELELTYNNTTYPVLWAALTAGYTIGAWVLLRTVDGGANDKIWMADSGATGLPGTTNGEDFRITLNNEAIIKAYQKP